MNAEQEKQLLPHRNAIDEIDAAVLELLNQRAVHARAIGELKGTGVVYRPEREAQVLRRIKELNRGPLSDEGAYRRLPRPGRHLHPAGRRQTLRPRRQHRRLRFRRRMYAPGRSRPG